MLVEWTTASEENNDYFVVEYSTDGINWMSAGEVAGQGTTSFTTNYDYVHEGAALSGGVLYYRLRQVDFDGTTAYSDIAVVVIDIDTTEYKVFPNPAPRGGDVTILGDNIQEVEVYAINGQLMRVESFASSKGVVLSTYNLSSGHYIIVVNGKEKLKLVIQ